MKRLGYFLLALLLTFQSQGDAWEGLSACKSYFKGHRLLIGPEAYDVVRHRAGGTKQRGWLGGGRIIYDHIRRYKFYWAIEGALAAGDLKGTSGGGAKLKSFMRDRSIEARLGYTLQFKHGHKFACTPFIGAGYLIEDNNFKPPSAMHLHFKTSYRYLTAGFISSLYICNAWKCGLNVKVRHMLDPKCQVSHDPEFDLAKLNIGNDTLQYRIELPITYLYKEGIAFAATAFYENRVYGGWVGYPFDFLKTRLYYYGATLQLQLGF